MDEHHPDVYDYLPHPDRELPKTPKQWIANVCATLLENKFSAWVKYYVDNRHEKVAETKGLIDMDSEMARIFHQSTAVSSKST